MPQPVKDWIPLYRAFDPKEKLQGERSRELYIFREHDPFDREHDPFDRMCQTLRKDDQAALPLVVYFTGHRGSGKSSTLLRLLEHFTTDYFPIYFDVEDNLDNSKAHRIDLLYVIGATIFQAAVNEDLKPDQALLEALRSQSIRSPIPIKRRCATSRSMQWRWRRGCWP